MDSIIMVNKFLERLSNAFLSAFMVLPVLMIILSGCATKQVVIAPPEKPYDSRRPTEWQTLYPEPADASLRISVEFQVKGGNSLRMNGEIISCSYTLNSREERQIPTQRFKHSLNHWEQRWEREVRDKIPQRESWLPQHLEITNPYGSDAVVRVNSTGQFSGTLAFDRISYASPDVNRQKYKTFREVQPNQQVVFNAIDPPVSLSFAGRASLPPCWEAVPNYDVAKEFFRSKLAEVHIDVRDQGTRQRLMPKVIVTAISPTREEVMRELQVEFSGDNDLLQAVKHNLDDLVLGGQTHTSITDQIEFIAWDGGRYQIETILGGYHYFKTIISCDSPGPRTKEILLVDRGSKIRIENVEEGSVGSITDKP